MIDGVVLLTENLAPTYSVYVPSKFVTERTLASTVNSRLNSKEKQTEREKKAFAYPLDSFDSLDTGSRFPR